MRNAQSSWEHRRPTRASIQELVLHSHVINFRSERWLTADGKVITAPLPEGFGGHFGPQFRRFVLAQYHRGQTTVPRLVTLLRGRGIDISKREVVRLLTAGHDRFCEEARDVLRAGWRARPGSNASRSRKMHRIGFLLANASRYGATPAGEIPPRHALVVGKYDD
jgi:hypothetical protein